MYKWKLNTSNAGKLTEYKHLFSHYGTTLESTQIDLKEIESDPINVVVHKASQLGDYILVDDTSLDVEGAKLGINVRWLLDHLKDFVGHRAEWSVLLAYRKGSDVLIYRGFVLGTIVEPKGQKGFGFDPVFLPNGTNQTLAESKPDQFNARALAVEALLNDRIWTTHPVIENWTGPWQNS